MELKQFYLGCLSHASYLVGSDDECAIVDPQRDVEIYLDAARLRGMRIRWIVETHLHADFVSGHRELAERAGAEIVFGHRAGAAFPHRAVKDGDELPIGRASLRVLETPGHTPEGICLVAHDEEGIPRAVLTGDTLFIGDVGRPDLVGAAGFTPQQMASAMHDSLHDKLLKLPDDVEVLPAHGAGSLCGRSMSTELTSTIGAQRRSNPMLQPMSREEFIERLTADLPEQPRYFAMDVRLNRQGPSPLQHREPPAALGPGDVALRQSEGATLLDVRPASEFCAGHVPGSVNIGLSGQFAAWAGALLPLDRPLVLVADTDDQATEAQLRLARVGLEDVAGRLAGGLAAWQAAGMPVRATPQVPAAELPKAPPSDLLDVRRPAEHAAGHVPGAINIPLDRLAAEAGRLDRSRPLRVICQSGYRSSAAIGLLEQLGFQHLENVPGGTSGWREAGHPVEASPGATCSR